MRILVIDNYDSFTYNLCHLAAQTAGAFPFVRRNDEIALEEVKKLNPDAILLSPGPGHPARGRDFGICAEVLQSLEIPVLGVCLGHQGIGLCGGAAVTPAARAMHGIASTIYHHGEGLFAGIPQGFAAVRYHSFIVEAPLPDTLEKLAWTEQGEVMALRHRRRPFWGVQFHPESIATEYGAKLLTNFWELVREFWRERSKPGPAAQRGCVKRFDFYVEPEQAYLRCFAHDKHSFWLDSSATDSGQGRFSYMGGWATPGSFAVSYRVDSRQLQIESANGIETRTGSLFEYLRDQLKEHAAERFEGRFGGGFVGYFGFELKGDCGYSNKHRSRHPDAQLLYAPAVLFFDHAQNSMGVAAVEDSPALQVWTDELKTRLQAPGFEVQEPEDERLAPFIPRMDEQTYGVRLAEALREIANGESYEICLTDMLQSGPVRDPLSFYRRLRRANPAPYSAFLRCGDMYVACSSPERFLRIEAGRLVTSKPIKGTAARGATEAEDTANREALLASGKEAAEHLMIVDLVRNDLGRVCEPGSVSVPVFRGVESYARVHQLVSTVQGRLRPECGVVDCLLAAFPGGSMTGAPKGRTLEILDRLEAGPRGVYSGCIGYLGLDGGCDLNIVIRTAVLTPEVTEIGSGGAIVAASETEREMRELLLKVEPLTGLLRG